MRAPQFQILPLEGDDERKVTEIFAGAAATFHLLDTKVTSRAQNIVASYAEANGFSFGITAWRFEDRLVVAFHPGKAATEQFYSIFDFVVTQLREAFGNRLAAVDAQGYVELPNVLPQTDAARAIYRTLLRKTDQS